MFWRFRYARTFLSRAIITSRLTNPDVGKRFDSARRSDVINRRNQRGRSRIRPGRAAESHSLTSCPPRRAARTVRRTGRFRDIFPPFFRKPPPRPPRLLYYDYDYEYGYYYYYYTIFVCGAEELTSRNRDFSASTHTHTDTYTHNAGSGNKLDKFRFATRYGNKSFRDSKNLLTTT